MNPSVFRQRAYWECSAGRSYATALDQESESHERRCKRQASMAATVTVAPPQQPKLSAAATTMTPPLAKQQGGACRAEVARLLVLRCPDPSLKHLSLR